MTGVQTCALPILDDDADNSTTDASGNTTDYVSFDESGELILLNDELSLLLSLCLDEKIDVLKREYMLRLRKYQEQLAFFNYYKKHPGLEHKAGVPKGGTFVLVYDGEPRELREPVNAVGITIERGREEVLKGTTTDEPVDTTTSPYSTELTKMIMKFVEDCKDAPPKTKTPIITALNPPVIGTRRGLTEGAVIADFYIPYLCCSDCPPVAYIMPDPKPVKITKPVQQRPTIDAAGPFCNNDSSTIQLTGTPAGGTFGDSKGAAITGIGTDGSFVPAKLQPNSYDVYYTLKSGESANTTIVVLDADSDFTVSSQGNSDQTAATFTAVNNDAGISYAWQMSPEDSNYIVNPDSVNTNAFEVRFVGANAQSDPVTITLTTSGNSGKCTSNTSKTFSFVFSQEGGFQLVQQGS